MLAERQITMDKKVLDDELLKGVSGGKLIEEKVEEMMSLFIPIYKQLGLTKADFIEAVKSEWEENSKRYSTDSSLEDLKKILRKIERDYELYDWPDDID